MTRTAGAALSDSKAPHSQTRFVKFRYALPDIVTSTLCLLSSQESREADPWLDKTYAAMSSDLRRDLQEIFAPFGSSIILDRLVDESPVLDDVTSFIGWLASIDDRLVDDGIRDGIRRMAECGESGGVHDTAGHVDPECFAAVIAEWAGRRPNAMAPSPNDLDRIVHILQDPVEFKGILVFTVARFWQNHFRIEYADCARQIERNVEYQHHRSYPGAFSDYYAEVTGTPLPQRAVEDHPSLDTLLFLPCCRGGERTLYVRLRRDRRRIAIIYNCLLTREGESDARLPLRDIHGALRALADATRLEILALLDGRELFAQQIVERMSIGQSTVSRHLKVMVDAGLVIERPENGMKFYRIHVERLAGLARRLTLFRAPLGDMESGTSPEEEE